MFSLGFDHLHACDLPKGKKKFGPGFARNVVVLNIEVSTIYTLLDKKIKTSTSFALKRRANTRSEVIKVRFCTKMHFLLDITPLLTIFVAIGLTIFLCFTCRSVKMVGARLLLLAALI